MAAPALGLAECWWAEPKRGQQAEECLRASNSVGDQNGAIAGELIVMAASLHERALKLEGRLRRRSRADEKV